MWPYQHAQPHPGEDGSNQYAGPGGSSPSAQWPAVADDVFKVLHDDYSGTPLVDRVVVSLGLAGGLLCELALVGVLSTRNGKVVVAEQVVPPRDAAAHVVFDQMIAEPVRHPVRTWLTFLAQSSYDLIAQRLVRSGAVTEQTVRKVFSRSVVYVPNDPAAAAWPAARLAAKLNGGQALSTHDAVLGGLCLATDTHRRVLDGASPQAIAALRQTVAGIPHPLPELLHHIQTAVGEAVRTGR